MGADFCTSDDCESVHMTYRGVQAMRKTFLGMTIDYLKGMGRENDSELVRMLQSWREPKGWRIVNYDKMHDDTHSEAFEDLASRYSFLKGLVLFVFNSDSDGVWNNKECGAILDWLKLLKLKNPCIEDDAYFFEGMNKVFKHAVEKDCGVEIH